MSQYSSMTVAQLKDVLKEKGLSLEGKKADLVARLTENEAAAHLGAELDEEDAPAPAETEQKPEVDGVEAQEGAEPKPTSPAADASETNPEVSESSTNATQEKPKPKVLTADERKQLAIEHLTKKIKRAEKFGDDGSATAAKKDLARVEKFGVDLGTALAKEIGLLDRSVNSELGSRKFHKRSGKGRRVQK